MHYICTGGCGGVSTQPGTCDDKSCAKYHQPLTVCGCADDSHREAFENPNVTGNGQSTREE